MPSDEPTLTDDDRAKISALIAEGTLPCGGRGLKVEPAARVTRVSEGKRSVFALARLVDGLGWEGGILKLTCPAKDPRCFTHRSVVAPPTQQQLPNIVSDPAIRTSTAPGGTVLSVGDVKDWGSLLTGGWATGRGGVLSPPTATADPTGAPVTVPSGVAPRLAPAPGTSPGVRPLKGTGVPGATGAIAGAKRWCQAARRGVGTVVGFIPWGPRARSAVKLGAPLFFTLAVIGWAASGCLSLASRVPDPGQGPVTTGLEPLAPPAPPLPTADTVPTAVSEPPSTTTWSMPAPCGLTIGCTTFGGRS